MARCPHAARLLARAIALSAARTHLAGGHDVVIPQFLGRQTSSDGIGQTDLRLVLVYQWHAVELGVIWRGRWPRIRLTAGYASRCWDDSESCSEVVQ